MTFRREVRDMVRHLVVGRCVGSEAQLLAVLRHAVEAEHAKVWLRNGMARCSCHQLWTTCMSDARQGVGRGGRCRMGRHVRRCLCRECTLDIWRWFAT
jgi:hypothetical protein